jgi:hypothetical protein
MSTLIDHNEMLGSECRELTTEFQEISVALKVLLCSMNRQVPLSEDIQHLRSLVPEMADAPTDQLACVVVKKFTSNGPERYVSD